MAALFLGVAAYFGIQAVQYLDDPLGVTLAYRYEVERTVDMTGFVVREERVLPDESGGLLRVQRAEGERVAAGGTVASVYADQASLDRQAEIDSRQCLSGPHKDDLTVSIGGQSAKIYASQGQTRTAALSLKLAQREIFQEETGEWPVLLLDDVLSELDPKRQAFVLNRIRGGQVFITCCEEEKLEGLEGGRAFHIRDGKLV